MKNSDALLIYIVCYSMIFLITWISKLNKSNKLFDEKGIPAAKTRYLIGLHVAGIMWLGLVPILFNGSFKTLLFGGRSLTLSWMLLYVFLFLSINFIGIRASRQVIIKTGNISAPSNNFLPCYFAARILFLCAYELFFRGYLLFDGIKWFGILPAVILTTGLTVLIHVFTNKKEMWACIPFGMICCSCCIAFGAVWPAIALHLALSFAYEIPHVNHFVTQIKLIK